MTTPQISLRGVGMRYFTPQGETEALADVSFDIYRGEFVSLVGPSGCGKSTFLSLIAGILKPTTGQVLLDGSPVTGPSPRIGYMLQQDHLLPWRTVMGNCLLGPEIRGLDLELARDRAEHFLVRTGLYPFRSAYPDQLSGGMRQRVALVRTLVIDPDILLLDEPFSALDFPTRLTLADEVWTILRQEKKTVLLVTHDISEAITMSDRVLVLTGRPGQVKSEHLIRFADSQRPAPFEAREAPEYTAYFHRIWGELEIGHQAR